MESDNGNDQKEETVKEGSATDNKNELDQQMSIESESVDELPAKLVTQQTNCADSVSVEEINNQATET